MKFLKFTLAVILCFPLIAGCGSYRFTETKYPNADEFIIGDGRMIVLDIRHKMGQRKQFISNFNYLDVYLNCDFYRSTRDLKYEYSRGEKKDSVGRIVIPMRTFPGIHLVDLRYMPSQGMVRDIVFLRDVPVDDYKMTYIVCEFSDGDPFKFEVKEAYFISALVKKKIPIVIKSEINYIK